MSRTSQPADLPLPDAPPGEEPLWLLAAAPLGVLALWLVGAAVNLSWLRLDNTPPDWDPSVHLGYALSYYAYLSALSPADAWAGIQATSFYYPPLVHVVAALLFAALGPIHPVLDGLTTADVAALGNLVYMGVLLLGTYSLAAQLYGRTAGLLAALLAASYPILNAQSRLFLLDYPLTALTVASMALLVASRGLTHAGWIWLLGLAASAALWCKWSFLFLFVPPALAALGDGVRRVRAGEVTAVRLTFNVVVLVAMIGLLAGPWYLANGRQIVEELLTSNQTWRIDDDPVWSSPAGLSYYLRVLLSHQLFLPFSLLALGGGVHHFLNRRRLDGGAILGLWLASGWLVFTVVANKDPRFSMPLLPALAVLSGSWLAPPAPPAPGPRLLRGGAVVAIGALAALQWVAVAFGLPAWPDRVGPPAAPLFSDMPQLGRHPAHRDWPHNELTRALVALAPRDGRIGVLPNTAHVNHLTIRYYVHRQLLPHLVTDAWPLDVTQVVHLTDAGPAPASVDSLLADGYDLIVTLTGDQGAHTELIVATQRNLAGEWARFERLYPRAATFTMPGGETLAVHRRAGLPPVGRAGARP